MVVMVVPLACVEVGDVSQWVFPLLYQPEFAIFVPVYLEYGGVAKWPWYTLPTCDVAIAILMAPPRTPLIYLLSAAHGPHDE